MVRPSSLVLRLQTHPLMFQRLFALQRMQKVVTDGQVWRGTNFALRQTLTSFVFAVESIDKTECPCDQTCIAANTCKGFKGILISILDTLKFAAELVSSNLTNNKVRELRQGADGVYTTSFPFFRFWTSPSLHMGRWQSGVMCNNWKFTRTSIKYSLTCNKLEIGFKNDLSRSWSSSSRSTLTV
jgi:hypothetical protein